MKTWQDAFVTANGIQLHYWRTGGDKPPLVLSHGITDNGLCWAREAEVLESAFDVIMVDARGHGLSDRPEHGYLPGDHAADLAALIEALALDRPRLMGHSMGAMTTALMAYERPDLVSRMVLEDPPFRDQAASDNPANAQEMAEWKKRLAAQQQLPTTEIIAAGRVVNPGWAEEVFPPWADAKKQVSLNVFGYRLGVAEVWQEAAAGLEPPTLLLTGDPALGAIVTPAVASTIAESNPLIQVHNIAGAGHNIRRDRFEEYMQVVRDFLVR